MKLSTKTRYAARAMIELASVYPDKTLSAREIAASQGISANYLEQIMGSLRAAGLVRAVRGMHGGYRLARPPEEVRLSDLYQTLEGSLSPVECVDDPDVCPMEDKCPTRQTWAEMKEAVMKVLEGTTLQDLVDRRERLESGNATYQI